MRSMGQPMFAFGLTSVMVMSLCTSAVKATLLRYLGTMVSVMCVNMVLRICIAQSAICNQLCINSAVWVMRVVFVVLMRSQYR